MLFFNSIHLLQVLFLCLSARDAWKREVEEMSEETRAVFENIKFYKFYPVQTPDTPDLSNYKVLHVIEA